MNNQKGSTISSSVELRNFFVEILIKNYTIPLRNYLKNHSELISTCPGFLVNFTKIIVYICKTHIAIEYDGPSEVIDVDSEIQFQAIVYDYATEECNLLEKIIGFNFNDQTGQVIPLPIMCENMIFPTSRGLDEMLRLNWNFIAQESMIFLNIKPVITDGKFTRIVNSFFFDANRSGLITRHVKWIDFYPIKYDSSNDFVDTIGLDYRYFNLYKYDAYYHIATPEDYKFSLLPSINRFIELCGNTNTTENAITNFVSDNKFILTMRFGAKDIYPQLICEWQNETKQSLRPDFFLLHPNGYADIVEFKLPFIEKTVVGSVNRERFSAFLNSYIAQLRVYSKYFDDSHNRLWFKTKYGFDVYKPKKILIVGRRSDFSTEQWRDIVSDISNVEIHTYDDLIDGVVCQFHHKVK